ncbi:hypothetical protein [Sutcliffiella cohnii]|uniref:hypothetical protein n=1 Tax=Sutcliffiella cohnii TaxID=33932 RepID=UPI00083717B5|nr:hypothetical protein [Sutcliffiella cohnii]
MSKSKSVIKRVKESNSGMVFEGEYVLSLSHCVKCKEEFVLYENDNPSFDGPRVLEFPDVCGDCL